MIQQRLKEWVEHPEMLNKDTLYELRTVLAHYPFFQTARLLYLKNLFLLHDIGFGEELRKSALYISDRRVLFSLVEGDNYSLKATAFIENPEETPCLDRTLMLIDTFLSSLPEQKMSADEVLPVEMAADYTSYLMKDLKEEESDLPMVPQMKGQQLIDNFLDTSDEQPLISSIADEEEENENPEDLKEKEDEEDYFTETLAKIYVKQQRYSKALEIIQRLNLKYPKKNAYFADQIRFLEKLIINSKFK